MAVDKDPSEQAQDGEGEHWADILSSRDVLAEVLRRLGCAASAGALRATCRAVRAATDASLPALAPRARPADLSGLARLLGHLPALEHLSLGRCADGAAAGLQSFADAEAALWPLAHLLAARLPRLVSLELPVAPLLDLGALKWASVWAAGACLPPEEGRAALRAATAGRYVGAYRPLASRPHSVLLLPGWLVGPGVRRLVITRAEGATAAWPDDQTACVWMEPGELEQVESLAIEQVCLSFVPPPVLQLASSKTASLRALRLHCCQIRQLLGDAVGRLSRLTSLELSGNLLKSLPEGMSCLKALRRLDVSGNSLVTLCNGLGALTNLESLDVSHNQLLALPRCLRALGGLRALVLSHNWLNGARDLGDACSSWPHLTELRVANVSTKSGALSVPAAALAANCPRLAVLDVSAQFQLEVSSLEGLGQCRGLRQVCIGYPQRDAARRVLQRQLPGLVVE